VKLHELTRAMLEQAVRIYLEEAYGDAPPPEAVQARRTWPAGATLADLAMAPPFERMPGDVPLAECERIRLRLGNRDYPHMKLGADHVPDSDDWVLVVDAHDRQLVAVVTEGERAALEALIRRNADRKTRIERRWAEAGLPTFEHYIRSRLGHH
jgi:hypothetical protein